MQTQQLPLEVKNRNAGDEGSDGSDGSKGVDDDDDVRGSRGAGAFTKQPKPGTLRERQSSRVIFDK